MIADLFVGAAVSAPVAFLTCRTGRITSDGAATGVVLAGITYAAFYVAGLAVLGVALLLTLLTSHAARKRRQPDAVADDDRRSMANIAANCGVGTLAAIAELVRWDLRPEMTAVWFVTAIAAGASDTVASETGKAFGGWPRAFPTGRPVRPGTPGAVSIVGTVFGIAGSGFIAAPAIGLWLLPSHALPIVLGACLAGAFVESALATVLESRGLIGNHALNFLNTAVAALVALVWFASA